MKAEEFKEKDYVAYVPLHAHRDLKHPDVERGLVSSQNEKMVFVKFFPAVERNGWHGTTAQPCDPDDLVVLCRHEVVNTIGNPVERDFVKEKAWIMREQLEREVADLVERARMIQETIKSLETTLEGLTQEANQKTAESLALAHQDPTFARMFQAEGIGPKTKVKRSEEER